jgi:hypothetical protein
MRGKYLAKARQGKIIRISYAIKGMQNGGQRLNKKDEDGKPVHVQTTVISTQLLTLFKVYHFF